MIILFICYDASDRERFNPFLDGHREEAIRVRRGREGRHYGLLQDAALFWYQGDHLRRIR